MSTVSEWMKKAVKYCPDCNKGMTATIIDGKWQCRFCYKKWPAA